MQSRHQTKDKALSQKKTGAAPPKIQTASLPQKRKPLELLKALLVRKELRRPLTLTEDHIRSVLLVRRARSDILGHHLFSDPAWDILLELYAAKLGDRRMSLADVARAIDTPQSTTKRWATALEESGLVQSKAGLTDDVIWLSLTDQGADKLGDLTDHWGSAFLSI